MLGNQRPRNTNRDDFQQEGLVYKTKKVIIKHDRRLLAWMKAEKTGTMKLVAGSRPRHTHTADPDQTTAEETGEIGGAQFYAEGELKIAGAT